MHIGISAIFSKRFVSPHFDKIRPGHWALTIGWVTLYFICIPFRDETDEHWQRHYRTYTERTEPQGGERDE